MKPILITILLFITNNLLSQHKTAAFDSIKIDSANVNKYIELARNFQKQFQYQQAKILFEKIYSYDTTNVESINQLAGITIHLNNNKEALSLFNKTLRRDSLNLFALISSADLLQKNGNTDKAIERYSAVINFVDSTNYYSLKQLGQCYYAQGEATFPIAMGCYIAAHKVNPSDLTINYKLGNSFYNKLKEYDKTINLCDDGLQIDPENVMLTQLKGYTLFLLEKYKESEELFSKFLLKGDTTFFSIKYLGISQYFNIKPAESKFSLERAITYDSTDFDSYVILGDATLQINQPDKAQMYFEKAVSLTFPPPSKHAEVYVGLSNVYNIRKDWDKATEYLELASKANPNDKTIVFRLAAYYDFKKDYSTAIKLYKQVISEGNPDIMKSQIAAAQTRVTQLIKYHNKLNDKKK